MVSKYFLIAHLFILLSGYFDVTAQKFSPLKGKIIESAATESIPGATIFDSGVKERRSG